ncbi:MAG: Ig-like domain-containing protein [Ruminococcus sp.]
MRIVTKNTTALVLVIMLLITSAFIGAPVAKAESYPKTHPNTYVNTGVGADDIVGVAKTQVGYQENSAGTKYGYWYNQVFVNQPWCAMFVSWCANQAGIPETTLLKYASCGVGVNWFKSQGLWHDSLYYGGSYTPKKGDVVFYRNGGSSNLSDHTGIVVGVNGSFLHVIEGNSTNGKACEFKTNSSRTLKSSYVIGYGSPNYSGTVSEEPEEEPDTYEEWQVTDADSLSLRASYSTSSERYKLIPMGTILNVTEFKKSGDYFWGFTKYSGKEGWCALDYCTYIRGSIGGVYYQMPPSVSPKTATLDVGATKNLAVTNGLGATYSTTDSKVATVTKKGKIKAVSSGSATIKCKTQTGSAKCKITVETPKINKKTVSVCIGDKVALSVTGVKGTVVWQSSDNTIAKVTEDGNVTGIAKGEATITGTVGDVTLKCTVTVTKEPTTYENFTVNSKSAYLYKEAKGSKIVLIPNNTALKVTQVVYSDTYTWGKTKYNGKTGWVIINKCKYVSGSISGKVYKKRAFLAVTAKKVYLKNQYTLDVRSASGTVMYSSKDASIAKVDSKGVVTAKKAGKTYVYATNKDVKLKCKIVVINPVLSKSELSIVKANTASLKVKGGNGEIKWKSSDKNIVKIDKNGTVKGISYGKAKIAAKRNGIKMYCVVKVYDPVLSATKKSLYEGTAKTLKVIHSSGTVKWKSKDKTIAKVNSKGVVKGIKAGTTTIYAKADGVLMSCKVKVVKP